MLNLHYASSYADCDEVAMLHIRNIRHGFLPLLGRRVLARIYFSIASHENSALIVMRSCEGVVGFVAVTSSRDKVYKRLIVTFVSQCLWLTLKDSDHVALLKKLAYVIKNSAGSVRDAWKTSKAKGSVVKIPSENRLQSEVLSIAVADNSKNLGIGSQLIRAAEDYLKRYGVASCRVRTNKADKLSNSFYRKNGFVPVREICFHSLTLCEYRKDFSENDHLR